MKLQKSLVAALCAAGLLGLSAGGAEATIIFQFNPTGAGLGAGLINGGGTLDQLPGNDLALGGGAGGAGVLPVGSVINDKYQANLGSVVAGGGGNLFANGSGGNFFTFVAGFSETVTGSFSGGGSATNIFSVNPGGFFSMCSQSVLGNNLAGTGFACAPANTILSGHLVSGFASQTGFVTGLQPLDGFGVNNYPAITTVTSTGSASLILVVDAVNPGYFPDLLTGSFVTTSFTNTSLITPFNQVDPSALFSSNGVANGDVAGATVGSVGTINGLNGPNFMFQADANSSFGRVPEPGTLALLGLALVGMGVNRRRSKT